MTKLISNLNKLKKESSQNCDRCDGAGIDVIDHVAWLSGDDFYEKDIYGYCDKCDGKGIIEN